MYGKKYAFLNFLKVLMVWVVLSLSVVAGMQNIIFPFAIPIAIALMCLGVKSYIVSPLYFLSNLVNGINESDLIINGYASVLIFFIGLFYLKGNKDIKWWEGCVYIVFCELAFLYYNAYLAQEYLQSGLTLVVGCLTFICVKCIFSHFRRPQKLFILTLNESICLCFLVLIISSGVANIDAIYFSVYHLVGFFFILCLCYILNKNQVILFSVIYGLGYSLNTLEIGYIALFVCVALGVVSLKSEYKLYSVFIGIIIDVLLGMYFNTGINYNLISILEVLVASAVFACIPNKVFQYFSGYISSDGKNFGLKSIISSDKTSLQNKLVELSNVFNEMDIVFRKMIKGVLPVNDAKDMLLKESMQKVCADCKNRTNCFRIKHNISKMYYDLITIGFEKGRVTLLDVPQNFVNICSKTSQILIVINSLINDYMQYANIITNLDSSRLLIADQLNGVSRIMKELSKKVDEEICFDSSREKRIIEELGFNDVICNDAIVYTKDNYTTNVNLLVRNQDVRNPIIKAVVSKICGTILELKEVNPSEISGWSMINLSTMANYDIMFGYASICKNGQTISGDKYSVLRLSDNKFLMAICDGMGSGEKASDTSELAISLVENFYKAGFDNEIILSSINKLLTIEKDENFSALDICVIDLKNCFADFIKLGAPAGLIKHKETTTQVSGGALPIGILEEIKPVCFKTVLGDQDMIVLCSDGVTEAFKTNENFKNFVNNINTLHPQELADIILEKAVSLNLGIANDDMTIVVGRIFQKIG